MGALLPLFLMADKSERDKLKKYEYTENIESLKSLEVFAGLSLIVSILFFINTFYIALN